MVFQKRKSFPTSGQWSSKKGKVSPLVVLEREKVSLIVARGLQNGQSFPTSGLKNGKSFPTSGLGFLKIIKFPSSGLEYQHLRETYT